MPALTTITRPAPDEYAPYYQRYLDRIAGDDAMPPLERQRDSTIALLTGVPEAKALHRYAEGKWSVKETLLHVADAERVFAYRALRFARKDGTELAGFAEERWVPESGADARPLADLVDEYRAVRGATLALARSLTPAMTTRRGVANQAGVSVRALLWIIAGHENHHVNLLRERYGVPG
jgi:uncharacterized damage-inducible protein DinB